MLIGLNALFYAIVQLPFMSYLMVPLTTFVTTLHEFGHASACFATGGGVDALTIVSAGNGHAGLTYCRGGWPLVFTQAGYLGAAFFGCLLIWFGTRAKSSKLVLQGIGGVFLLISIVFILPGLIYGQSATQTLGSLAVALAIAGALFVAGRRLNESIAHTLLLIIGGQTALNALSGVFDLIRIHLGIAYYTGNFTDATAMCGLTGWPSAFWSFTWAGEALLMVAFTLWRCYGSERSELS